jgi:hypothetical protein
MSLLIILGATGSVVKRHRLTAEEARWEIVE